MSRIIFIILLMLTGCVPHASVAPKPSIVSAGGSAQISSVVLNPDPGASFGYPNGLDIPINYARPDVATNYQWVLQFALSLEGPYVNDPNAQYVGTKINYHALPNAFYRLVGYPNE